jgi:hypothetical protein
MMIGYDHTSTSTLNIDLDSSSKDQRPTDALACYLIAVVPPTKNVHHAALKPERGRRNNKEEEVDQRPAKG